ncbi:MAG TPA: hypothetical protein VD948_01305, partial [Rhodothermales bacterium]|nr:hypothetical protein [Rhodothermales bacterium]
MGAYRYRLAFLVALVLTPVLARAQSDILGSYKIQPDVWRPMQPLDPGVNANGDLNLSLPVLTVPGRGGLDYPVSLSYRSGIAITQSATWVGLGWSFDPGSITRDVQGVVTSLDGSSANDVDFAQLPSVQPDQYYVTVPSGGFTMTAKMASAGPMPTHRGTCDVPLVPTEWAPWKIDCSVRGAGSPLTVDSKAVGIYLQSGTMDQAREDFETFTLTAPDGVRYVFAAPTLSSFETFLPSSTYRRVKYHVGTWRLVSILSADFDGNALDPRTSTRGNWVYFQYGHLSSSSRYGESATSLMQTMYLTAIETPTHIASFSTSVKDNEIVLRAGSGGDQLMRRLDTITLCAKASGAAETGCTQGKKVREVAFEYLNYDTGALAETGQPIKRMQLQRFFYKGHDGSVLPGHGFTYYERTFYGARPWTDYKDEFGYLNLCTTANEDPINCVGQTQDAHAWSLKTITYPTGGRTEIDYENDLMDATGDDVLYYSRLQDITGGATSSKMHYSARALRQGGARVKQIRRYASPLAATAEGSSDFVYGPGVLSGVPGAYWAKTSFYSGSSGEGIFLRTYDRRSAAVYYDHVREVRTIGQRQIGPQTVTDTVSTTTYYSTNHHCRQVYVPEVGSWQLDKDCLFSSWARTDTVGTASTVFVRVGENRTVVQDNSALYWGLPYRVRETAGDGRTTERYFQYEHASTGDALSTGYSNNTVPAVKVYWRYGRGPAWEETRTGRAGSAPVHVGYAYDVNTDLVRAETLRVPGKLPLLRERAYAFEQYSWLATKNVVAPLARENVVELDGGARRYLAASASTWAAFHTGPEVYYPKRNYTWRADAPSTSEPVFATAGWTGGSPGSAWVYDASNDAYDAYGHVTTQTDGRGL